MQTTQQRIQQIRDHFCDGKNAEFARMIGVSSSQASNLCNGFAPLGKQTQEKILKAFPQVSPSWLILGEGSMISSSESQNNIQKDVTVHGANAVGNGATATSSNSVDFDKVLDMLAEKDAQMRILIETIANITKQ